MKNKIFLASLTLTFSFLSFSVPISLKALHQELPLSLEKEKPATIKVLIYKNIDGALLEARGPHQIINPENKKKLSTIRKGKRFYLHSHAEGIRWGEDFPGIFQLQILPTSPSSTLLIDGKQYRGSLEIYHIEGKLSIINEVDVETFLKATLPEKIPIGLSSTCLDALVIVERTNAYYKAFTNRKAFWHTRAEEMGYEGIGLAMQNSDLDRAIESTQHLIMTFEQFPFPATWTEHSGGKTANYSTLFRKKVATPSGVTSIFAAKGRKENQWILVLDTQEFANIIKTNRITSIDLFVDHFSNKTYALRIHDGIHTEEIDFFSLQNKIGKDRWKSNDFSLTIKDHTITIKGYGKGCGVGLCLFSATQMGERGESVPKILSDFFPCSKLEKMRSLPNWPKKKWDKKKKLLH